MSNELKTAESPKKRKRFSSETANDLLFWGAHLMLVAISLGIMWTKVDSLAKAMKSILIAEERQNRTLADQAQEAMAATVRAQQAEHVRSIQFDASSKILDGVLRQVSDIQLDIKATLAKTNEINQAVLAQSEATKAAALQSQQAAQNAAGAANVAAQTAGGAASAAARAAAVSSRTSSVVASKVAVAPAKAELIAQQRTLAAKQRELTKTIHTVKKNGPTLWQKLTH
jgi:hypothetical protein